MNQKLYLPIHKEFYIGTPTGIALIKFKEIRFNALNEYTLVGLTPTNEEVVFKSSDMPHLYASAKDFEAGKWLNPCEYWTTNFFRQLVKNYDPQCMMLYYYDKGVQSMEVECVEFVGTITDNNRFSVNTNIEYFGDLKTLWAYNDYEEITAEGIMKHTCPATLLKLTDKQYLLINKLKKAFTDCKEAGITFVQDTENMDIVAFNTLTVDVINNYGSDCEGEVDMQDSGVTVFRQDIYLGCDDKIIIKEKSNK